LQRVSPRPGPARPVSIGLAHRRGPAVRDDPRAVFQAKCMIRRRHSRGHGQPAGPCGPATALQRVSPRPGPAGVHWPRSPSRARGARRPPPGIPSKMHDTTTPLEVTRRADGPARTHQGVATGAPRPVGFHVHPVRSRRARPVCSSRPARSKRATGRIYLSA